MGVLKFLYAKTQICSKFMWHKNSKSDLLVFEMNDFYSELGVGLFISLPDLYITVTQQTDSQLSEKAHNALL